MKRILVALMVLISATTFAQTSVTIINNTSCNVYYDLALSANNTTACPIVTYSAVISIAPGTNQTYKGAYIITPYDVLREFLGARIYKSDPACSGSYVQIGVCAPLSLTTIVGVYSPTCSTSCGNITATWTPPNAGGNSRLTFN